MTFFKVKKSSNEEEKTLNQELGRFSSSSFIPDNKVSKHTCIDATGFLIHD